MEHRINEEVINRIFDGYLLNKAIPHYCITYKGKIIVANGKMLYNSKQQASRAFYNMFRWRLSWVYRQIHHIDWNTWVTEEMGSDTWKEFRNTIKDDLKIVEV